MLLCELYGQVVVAFAAVNAAFYEHRDDYNGWTE